MFVPFHRATFWIRACYLINELSTNLDLIIVIIILSLNKISSSKVSQIFLSKTQVQARVKNYSSADFLPFIPPLLQFFTSPKFCARFLKLISYLNSLSIVSLSTSYESGKNNGSCFIFPRNTKLFPIYRSKTCNFSKSIAY